MFTIEIPGLPRECDSCGNEYDTGTMAGFPLAEMNGQIIVQCPYCFARIGPILAVRPAGERDA